MKENLCEFANAMSPGKPGLKQLGTFKIEKTLILNEDNTLKTSGRTWTQNVYKNIPYDIVPCFLNVGGRTVDKRHLDFYCYCKYDGCEVKYRFK